MFSPEAGPKQEIACTDEFKDLIEKNPDLIPDFARLEIQALRMRSVGDFPAGTELGHGSIKLTALNWAGTIEENEPGVGFYFKVEADGQTFFVKKRQGYDNNLGVQEFNSAQLAKEKLKSMTGTEVVDFQLGYQDDKKRTYFVSKWRDGIPLNKYLKELYGKRREGGEGYAFADNEIERLTARLNAIQERLDVEFADVSSTNMLYDKNTDSLVVFDIHKRV